MGRALEGSHSFGQEIGYDRKSEKLFVYERII